jgi:preprotein translocase subunit SecD
MRRGSALLLPIALTACVARMPTVARPALLVGDIVLPAIDIISASPGFSPNGQPLVNVRLSPAGAVQLESVTRAYLGRDMPIRIGATLLSNPRVMEPIAGGQFQISGLMSVGEAQELANRIAGR